VLSLRLSRGPSKVCFWSEHVGEGKERGTSHSLTNVTCCLLFESAFNYICVGICVSKSLLMFKCLNSHQDSPSGNSDSENSPKYPESRSDSETEGENRNAVNKKVKNCIYFPSCLKLSN
jgi:hypothetical protein